MTGALIAAVNLVMAVVGLNYGRLRARWDYRGLAVVVFASYAVGLGVGLSDPTLNGWTIASVDPATRTRALGLLTSVLFLAQFASPLIAQPVIDATGLGGTFVLAGVLGAVVAAGLVLWAAIGRTSHGRGASVSG